MTKNWIKGAIKNPGFLRATAKKHKGINKEGNIKGSFLKDASDGKYGAKTKKRANLAKTLKRLK